jgi:predicted permease
MDNLLADLRRATRVLMASPGLVLVSVLSLGLGLGANLTLFSFLRAAFFYQPEVSQPDRVVGVRPGNSNQYSYLNFRDLQDSGIFESVAGFRRVQLNLRADGEPERVPGLAVTADFFTALGIPAAIGRTFDAAQAAPERQPRVAVLSHAFWQRRFSGSVATIGQSVTINGEPFDIIGVLPDGHRAITPRADPAIYVPISALVLPTIDDRSNGNALDVLGRLRPGTTREQAQAAVTVLGQQLAKAYPDDNNGMERPATILPLRIREFGGWQEPVLISAILFALVGLVLLSACANVAGLLLARNAHRQRDIAVRVALGAGRGRLLQMLLTESFGLALLGVVAGAALFLGLARVLQTVGLPAILGSVTVQLDADAGVLVFALGLTVVTGILCGLVPAWRATQANVVTEIKSGDGHGASARLWLRHAFVVAQVAVSVILLVVSSLLVRSLVRVRTLDPGLDLDRVVVAMVNVDAQRYALDGGLPLSQRIIERVESMPGVEAASVAGILAMGPDMSATRLQVDGEAPGTIGARTLLNSVGPRYFATLGIPFVSGRDFAPTDRDGAPTVAIVNEALARVYFPGESALGKRVRRSEREPYSEIVGVVRDSKFGSMGEEPTPVFYSAYMQRPRISTQIRPVIVHVRTAGVPAAIVPELRRAIAGVDPTVVADVRTLRDATGGEAQLRQFGTQMIGAIGAVALLLATVGLYGMMAFVVSSRTREIGTRMALGAGGGRILRNVLTQGLRLVAIGIAIGGALSWMLAQLLRGALAGLSPADPIAFGSAILVLTLTGIAAIYIPARRAAALNPVDALRVE